MNLQMNDLFVKVYEEQTVLIFLQYPLEEYVKVLKAFARKVAKTI